MRWLTHDDFAALVGAPFTVGLPGGQPRTLVLSEAVLGRDEGGRGPHGETRRQFALVFDGPAGLPQGTWEARHDELGELALFLVPIGPGRYEAAFA